MWLVRFQTAYISSICFYTYRLPTERTLASMLRAVLVGPAGIEFVFPVIFSSPFVMSRMTSELSVWLACF